MLGGEIFIVVAAAWQQNKRVTRPASSQYRRVKSCVTLVMSYSQLTLTYSAGNPDSLFQYLKPILYFIDVAHVIECMFMLIAVIMLITPALTLPGYYCNYHTLFSSHKLYFYQNMSTLSHLKHVLPYRNVVTPSLVTCLAKPTCRHSLPCDMSCQTDMSYLWSKRQKGSFSAASDGTVRPRYQNISLLSDFFL